MQSRSRSRHTLASRPGAARWHNRLPVRSRRRSHPDGEGACGGMEADVRRVFAGSVQAAGEPFREFEMRQTTPQYVDGKLRQDGVRAFLASRGIVLRRVGRRPADGIDRVWLGDAQERSGARAHRAGGVEVYEGSVRFVEAVHAPVCGGRSSRRARTAAGAGRGRHRGPVRGARRRRRRRRDGLRGKPAPDMFLAAAAALGAQPVQCAVFEDAVAGVEAGRAGAFGWVVGVDRVGQADLLRSHGADGRQRPQRLLEGQ